LKYLLFGEISLISDFRLYPGDTNISARISSHHEESIRKRHPNFSHVFVSFGCSVTHVYCFRRRVILCSSTSDAQNVFAKKERFQITVRVARHKNT